MESSCFFRRNIFDIVRWTFIMMRVSRWSRVSSIRIIFIVLSSERFFFDKSRICFPENNLKKKLDISDKFTAMIYYIIITNKIIHLFLSCNKNSISITLLSMILVRLHESGPRFLSKETNWTPCPLVLTGMRHCAKMKIASLIAYKKRKVRTFFSRRIFMGKLTANRTTRRAGRWCWRWTRHTGDYLLGTNEGYAWRRWWTGGWGWRTRNDDLWRARNGATGWTGCTRP